VVSTSVEIVDRRVEVPVISTRVEAVDRWVEVPDGLPPWDPLCVHGHHSSKIDNKMIQPPEKFLVVEIF